MSYFFRLFLHECKMLLLSGATYVAGCLFLVLMAIFYWAILIDYAQVEHSTGPLFAFFNIFWIPALFAIPLLTMRSIAQERYLGTLESILATPVRPYQWVLAKFFSIYFFYVLLWGLTLFFPWVTSLTLVYAKIDILNTTTIVGGFIFVALSSFLYTSIGLFCSSLTRSQLVAGMLSFSCLLLLVVSGKLLSDTTTTIMSHSSWVMPFLDYLQTFEHLEDFCLGILDTRPFVFYILNAVVVLWATTLIVEHKT